MLNLLINVVFFLFIAFLLTGAGLIVRDKQIEYERRNQNKTKGESNGK